LRSFARRPFNITRSDPGLDAVVAADTKAELIASGFGLNEGRSSPLLDGEQERA
jgi:hypothetical protein